MRLVQALVGEHRQSSALLPFHSPLYFARLANRSQTSPGNMSNFQLPAGFRPSAGPSSGGAGGGGPSPEEQAAAREKAAAQEEMKRGMISAMLEPEARERRAFPDKPYGVKLIAVSRISLTRPQMAQQVTELLVRMGQQGQIRGKVTDEALKGLLTQVSFSSSYPAQISS